MPMPSTALPLLPSLLGDTDATLVAHLADGAVDRGQLCRHIEALAQALPEASSAINLCEDRYWFTVAWLACIRRGMVTLLPNSNAPQHLAQVQARHPGCLTLGDRSEPLMADCHWVRVDTLAATSASTAVWAEVPTVPADLVVARFFTSGSTGEPKTCDKQFGHLVASHQAARQDRKSHV